MNLPRITLLGSHERALREHLESHEERHERAAAILFRRIDRSAGSLSKSTRYLSVDVVPFDSTWITDSSEGHVAFKLSVLRELFRRCEEEDLVFSFAHNHPNGPQEFSSQDDENEACLLDAISNRNGLDSQLVALLLCEGKWFARVSTGNTGSKPVPVRHISILGDSTEIHLHAGARTLPSQVFARQEAAFGKPFVEMLSSLRVAVVGAGGTGSAVATLLARAGVGELVIIDNDKLEETNLNRVKGARRCDVGRPKVSVLVDYLKAVDLPTSITGIEAFIDQSPEAIDALSTSDVVFGCTDDQLGRRTLNVAAYFYGLALIDIGLGGVIKVDADGHGILHSHFGRVSVVLPESGECLFCQRILQDERIRYDEAKRQNPELSAAEAKERYLQGGGEQAPGVGPFTSATADFAVATLFDLIRPYRKFPTAVRRDYYEIDFVKMSIRSREPFDNHACEFCGRRSFLGKREAFRLGMPALGKVSENA